MPVMSPSHIRHRQRMVLPHQPLYNVRQPQQRPYGSGPVQRQTFGQSGRVPNQNVIAASIRLPAPIPSGSNNNVANQGGKAHQRPVTKQINYSSNASTPTKHRWLNLHTNISFCSDFKGSHLFTLLTNCAAPILPCFLFVLNCFFFCLTT